MVWLENLFKSDNGGAWQLIVSAAVLVILLLVLIWIFRKIIGNSRLKATKNRIPRLSVTDSMPVDETRHLVLIRRDNLEHLVLIGGPSDVVIETGIVRVPKNNQAGTKNGLSPIEAIKTNEAETPSSKPSVVGSVGGVAAAGIGGVTGALSATKDVVTDTGSAVVEKTSNVVSATADTTMDAAKAVGNKTSEVASATIDTTKDVASKTVETAKDAVVAVGEKTTDVASAAVETTKDVAENVIETTKDATQATTKAIGDSVEAITPETQETYTEPEEMPEMELEASLTEHLDQELSIDTPQPEPEIAEVRPNKESSSKEELQKLLDELAN